ncbi:MAG: tetratricopeptide repeat protein [Limisphaerales bacterium]
MRLVPLQNVKLHDGQRQNVNIPATASVEKQRLIFVSPLPGRWIRQTGCLIVLALLLTAGLVHAASGSSTMDAANDARQGYSASALFNLANAQQRDGQLGQAILNYERAALLAPNDSDIAANLGAARKKAGLELEHSSPLQVVAQTLTINTWFALAAVTLFLFAVSWPLKLLRPHTRRALNIGSVAAALVLAVAIGALGLRSSELNRAVVVAPEAVAGVSPVTMAAPVFKLRAGEIVRWQKIHGNFALIRNQAGHEGWVNAEKIEQIIPAKL